MDSTIPRSTLIRQHSMRRPPHTIPTSMASISETATNLTVKSVARIKSDSDDAKITFSNGLELVGQVPYSEKPYYSYDVTFQRMRVGDPLLTSMMAKRLPLSSTWLMNLIAAANITLDEDTAIAISDLNEEDVLPTFTEQYPDLLDRLTWSQEGLKYVKFEVVHMIYQAYGIKLVDYIRVRTLRALCDLVITNPALIAFPFIVPQAARIEPKDLDSFQALMGFFNHNPKVGESAAFLLYKNWLKKEMDWGHTCAGMRSANSVQCAGFNQEGLDFLKENNLLTVQGQMAQLSHITEMELNIRRSCETLKERFNAVDIDESRTKHIKTSEIELSDEQNDAISRLLNNPVAILSGKAGSGKTTILTHIVDLYGKDAVIACGPTNRAAKVLTERVAPARTIHRLVYDMVEGDTTEEGRAAVKIAIIDEASMLSLDHFAYCLEVLVTKCPNLQRLYLVGDVAQLEPVGMGSVLADMAEVFPISELTENHRVTPESMVIHENAMKIRAQNVDLKFHSCFSMSPCTSSLYNDLEQAIETAGGNVWNIHIISPYKTETKQINELAKLLFTGKPHVANVFDAGDKIVCTKNHNKHGVTNGDFFKILRIEVHGMVRKMMPGDPDLGVKPFQVEVPGKLREVNNTQSYLRKGEWYALAVVPAPFTNEEEEALDLTKERIISYMDIPQSSFALGYCTTTHKMQGGEADNVIYDIRRQSLSGKSTCFVNWKQVYTAITRAKKKVVIMGTETALYQAINRRAIPRNTLLAHHLNDEDSTSGTPRSCAEDSLERMEELLNSFKFERDEEE